VASVGFDCGGRVLALLTGQAFSLGEGVGQLGAKMGVLLLEGGYLLDLATAEGLLPLSRRHRHNRQVTDRY
jgi:hypothetical protein